MQTDFEVKKTIYLRGKIIDKVQHIKNIKLDPYELIIKKTKNLFGKNYVNNYLLGLDKKLKR